MILNIVIDFLRRRRHHPTLLLPVQEVLFLFDWSGFRPWLHPVSLAALVIFSCEMEKSTKSCLIANCDNNSNSKTENTLNIVFDFKKVIHLCLIRFNIVITTLNTPFLLRSE